MYLLLCLSLLSPLLVFFDYHKRSDIYFAIIYVVVFAAIIFLLRQYASQHFLFILWGAMPLIMAFFLFIARKRKAKTAKKPNHEIIDHFD